MKRKTIIVLGALCIIGSYFLISSFDFMGGQKYMTTIDEQNMHADSESEMMEAETVEIADALSVEAGTESMMMDEENETAETQNAEAVVSSSVLTYGPPIEKTALLANGCFWCVEHDLEEVFGVIDIVSGYAGGSSENPTYGNYIGGNHREVVLVTYDAQKVSYANLVEHIIKHGDPTDATGSFGDRGTQYAPAIYFENTTEESDARKVITAIDALHVFDKPLPLIVIPRVKFWSAEEYHQDYAQKNPLRYNYYRLASGRDSFIKKYWGDTAEEFTVSAKPGVVLNTSGTEQVSFNKDSWNFFVKPSEEVLRSMLTKLQYRVTQEEGTETPFLNEYDENYEEGIYVDIISGEPLYLSKDKYDSGTGWPSFVKPISLDVVVLKEDKGFFSTRTEIRSRYADSHVGHVFDDGPTDRGGKRYCMNSAAMRFVPRIEMEKEGYAYLFQLMDS